MRAVPCPWPGEAMSLRALSIRSAGSPTTNLPTCLLLLPAKIQSKLTNCKLRLSRFVSIDSLLLFVCSRLLFLPPIVGPFLGSLSLLTATPFASMPQFANLFMPINNKQLN